MSCPLVLLVIIIVIAIVFVVSLLRICSSRTVPVLSSGSGIFGEVLIADSGKGNKAILTWWVIWIIGAVAVTAYFAFLANAANQREVAVFAAGVAILTPIFFLVYAALYHRSIANTYIQVQENGVEGKGVGIGFIWGDVRSFGFQLNYQQITSVSATGTAIIIHASGTQYKCYTANPAEIQRAIVGQQQKKMS